MIGLDVSVSSAKLVELGMDKAGNIVLERCAIEPLERGWIVEGNIEKFEEVGSAIKKLLKKSGTKSRNVAMALPPSAVITKKVLLPSGISPKDLEQQVEVEASQYIPFPLEEVNLDFCVVGPSSTVQGEVEVLIAASKKDKVQDIQGLAEAVGLTAVILDVESYASRLAINRLTDRLPEKGKGKIVALFEIGSYSTSMQVIRDDEALYERDQAFGGIQLTRQIVSQYGFSTEEAETKKRNGELPKDYENTVLMPFLSIFVEEIAQALQYFFTSTTYNKIDHIFMAGGSAALMGLAEAVSSHTEIACTQVNPFEGMEISSSVRMARMAREAPSYLTSCGLALRRFDK